MHHRLFLLVLLPFTAQAASVLLVPEDEKSARALASELVDPFSASKLTVKTAPPGSPATSCLSKGEERIACLAAIGEKAKAIGVFVVSGGMKGSKGTVTLELIVNGAVVKKDTTKVSKGRVKQQMKGPISQLVKLLPKAGEAAAPVETVTKPEPEPEPAVVEPFVAKKPEPEPTPVPVVRNDTPKKTEPTLVPRARDDELDLRTPAPTAGKPKVAAWVMTILTLGAAGTAATFSGLALSNKGKLDAAPDGVSSLSYQDAQALQQTTNTQFTVALGTGIGAGVGAVITGILWGAE